MDKTCGKVQTGNRAVEIHRRDLLLAAGATFTVGFDSAVSSDAKAATGPG